MGTVEILERAIDRIESDERLDALAASLRDVTDGLGQATAGAALRGEWLGHALHPPLSDLPIGCWVSASVIDLVGGRSGRRAAQRLVGVGLLAAVPTVAAGLAEVPELTEARTRRVVVVHAAGNTVATVLYLASWRARRRGHHGRGVALALAGAAAAAASGYLGGHLAFARHVGSGER